ncbi:MAG: hypothetical protein ACLP1X_20445 [Polyangiaceae bacterium]
MATRLATRRAARLDGRAGDLVRTDPDLWAYFGSGKAVNKALRDVVAERRGR